MSSKTDKQTKKYIEKKNIDPLKVKVFENNDQLKSKKNGLIYISYRLDKHLLKDNKYIVLFRDDFIEKNKNKFNIIICKRI